MRGLALIFPLLLACGDSGDRGESTPEEPPAPQIALERAILDAAVVTDVSGWKTAHLRVLGMT